MPAAKDTHQGFTLIELMIVIGLLGVMMGVVFLRLDTLVPSTRLKSDARRLASYLEQAFNHCVVSGRQVRFEYDIDLRSFRFFYPFELAEDGLTILGEGETSVVDWERLSDTILIHDVRIGEGDPISSGRVFVDFQPRGVVTGHVVHLTKEGSDNYFSILVSPLLGYVDVVSGFVEAEVLDESEL
ncbi:MAG: prepilin-type N-terminal cleavage/methylation domain-containing protein [Planctomycetota bacterium]